MNENNENIIVKKANGDLELFDKNKLINSLKKAGAAEDVINQILEEIDSILYHEISTKLIYQKAFSTLQIKNSTSASKYNLKNALMKLGPNGFVFECFIGKLFEYLGYNTEVSSIISGKYVTHEIDVLAIKDNKQTFIECKYHLRGEKRVGVQVPLYVNSRINDIIAVRKKNKIHKGVEFEGQIVTNTRFSSDAIAYGEGMNLKLLGWDYPYHEGLKEIIEKEKIYPITLLDSISSRIKNQMFENKITTTRQIFDDNSLLNSYELTANQKQRIIDQVNNLSL